MPAPPLARRRRLLGSGALGARARPRRLATRRPGPHGRAVAAIEGEDVMDDEGVIGRALARDVRAAGRLALDTEFMGEGRYRTLLCLIQLAIPDRSGTDERLELIDPLAGGSETVADDLKSVLADPAVQIVVHAGRQDIALLRRRYGTQVRNVFDTQVAAGFAGRGRRGPAGPERARRRRARGDSQAPPRLEGRALTGPRCGCGQPSAPRRAVARGDRARPPTAGRSASSGPAGAAGAAGGRAADRPRRGARAGAREGGWARARAARHTRRPSADPRALARKEKRRRGAHAGRLAARARRR